MRKTFRGHPPLPFIIWQTAMKFPSMSGRSSRSTFTGTQASFRRFATSPSLKDSLSITWHQWHVA
ncbi:MAG TPA: hypothetical protein PK773_09065 [Aminivibrio sp.]|nr:hypothetical protein [Aminivibrio sp.]